MMGGSNKGAMLFSFSVMVICLLTVIGGGSFSLLWIQHEVSKVAKQTVLLEERHQEILRKLNHLDERIAKSTSTDLFAEQGFKPFSTYHG